MGTAKFNFGRGRAPLAGQACLPIWSVLLLGILSSAAYPVAAQSWLLEPSVGSMVTATNNSGLAFGSDRSSDVIVNVEPRLGVKGKGANFTLDGSMGLKAFWYTGSTQENRLLPSGTLALNANLVDRWLYLDASTVVEQVAADAYAVRADSDSSLNKINSVQYRFSPYIQHSFTPSFSLLARSDNTWTRRRGEFADTDPRRNSTTANQTIVLEQKPQPLGFSLEGAQEKTSYLTGQETVLQISSARAVVTYALDPTFTVGLTSGVEKSEYALTSSNDQIVGGRVFWAPTERTELRGTYERRFFGNGGSLQLSHRSPFIGLYLNYSREPSAAGTSFLLNPNGGDVQTLLNAIFTTRYPNPADRAIIVQSVIAGLGLPSVLGQPVEVFSDYAQLTNAVNASVVFQGVRSTVVTRVYVVKSKQLPQETAAVVPALADNSQKGFSVDFNRRLTTTLSVDLGVGYAVIDGLASVADQSTKNAAVRLGFTQLLSPKTTVTLGARYLKTDLTGTGLDTTAREAATYIGMVHRF